VSEFIKPNQRNDAAALSSRQGRRALKLAWVINFQKLATISLLGALLARYHNASAAAWIYFAMQTSYGLVWTIKDLAFPDSNFHKRITLCAGIASLLTVLGWYWVFGWLLISAVATHTRCLVQPMYQPMHFGVRDHDRRRCPEVLHSSPQTRADLPTARMMKQRICASMNLASAQ